MVVEYRDIYRLDVHDNPIERFPHDFPRLAGINISERFWAHVRFHSDLYSCSYRSIALNQEYV